MNVEFLRASSINTFEDCQFRYYLHNVIGMESKPGKKALLGTCYHWVFETLAKAKKNGHYKLGGRLIDRHYLTKVSWDHHDKLYPGLLEEKPDYKTLQKLVEIGWQADWNPLNLDILDVEKQFDIEVQGKGFKGSSGNHIRLRGTMDLVSLVNSDTIRISDYKTGMRKAWQGNYNYDEDSLKDTTQFKCYDTARRVIYPDYKYCLMSMIFVKEGGIYTVTFEDYELYENMEDIRRTIAEIKSCEIPNRLIDDKSRKDEHFKCRYVCPVGSRTDMYTSDCTKLYKLMLQGRHDTVTELTCQGHTISPRNDYSGSKIFQGTLKLDKP